MIMLFSLHVEHSAVLSDLRTCDHKARYFLVLFIAQNLDLQDLLVKNSLEFAPYLELKCSSLSQLSYKY